MQTPKVTIIVPAYNVALYLDESLDCLINQTLKEIEIIIIDDGSTDETPSILQKYAEKDSRIQIYRQENAGAGAARENALGKAQGEYVAFLDADDIFEPDLALHSYNKAKEHDADIVVYRAWAMDDKTGVRREANWLLVDEYLPEKEVFSKEDIPECLFQFGFTSIWNKLFKRSFLIEKNIHFPNYRITNTVGFVTIALAEASRIICLKEQLITYRQNRIGSLRTNAHEHQTVVCEAIQEIYEQLQKRSIYESVQHSFMNKAIDYTLTYLNQLKDGRAFEMLYNKLKSDTFPSLSISTYPKERYHRPEQYTQVQAIINNTPAEYLFNFLQKATLLTEPLPTIQLPVKSRIILYGAGSAGKQFFMQNIVSETYNIVLWVDKAYRDKPYPITSPDEMTKTEFDYILISILDKNVAKSITADLVKTGIPSEKIVLIGE